MDSLQNRIPGVNVGTLALVIVGAQKSGTSSLLRQLGSHREIAAHRQEEFPFFVDDKVYAKGYQQALAEYFPGAERRAVLVAKSVGIMYVEGALDRLRSHTPDAKLVALLRNPIDRAYSAFWYARQMGREPIKSFEQAIELEASRTGRLRTRSERQYAYIHRGQYAEQIEQIYRAFGSSNLSVFLFDDLIANPQGVFAQVLGLLPVDQGFRPDWNRKHNVAGQAKSELLARGLHQDHLLKGLVRSVIPSTVRAVLKRRLSILNRDDNRRPPMSPETRERLMKYYSPHNRKLEDLIGRDLSCWQ